MKKLRIIFLSLACVFFFRQFLIAGTPLGAVVGWGYNTAGEATGISSFPLSNGVPVIIDNPYATGRVTIAGAPLNNVTAISAGETLGLALKADSTVIGWGNNDKGRASGKETSATHPANGQVLVRNQVLSNIVSIATGGGFSLGLKRDGTVVAWGENKVPEGLSNVVAIAAHGFTSLALKRDGTVIGWPSAPWSPMYGQMYLLAGLSNVVAIAVGGGGNVARNSVLKQDGTVVVWGFSMSDEEPVPSAVTNVVAVAAGACHSLALKKDGTVFGWGCNTDGQATGVPTHQPPSDPSISSGLVTINGQILSNVVSIAAGDAYSMGLNRDGTVVMWGDKRFYRDVPAGLTNVTAIAAGNGFCLALTTNTSFLENKK